MIHIIVLKLSMKDLKVADSSQEILALNPMTFNEPGTNEPFRHWVDYYNELNHPIPEGELGLNPGGMSRSDAIDIVYIYLKNLQVLINKNLHFFNCS
jgi:hypothetical protein